MIILSKSYRHLIYDNIEEDVPRAHDLIREWLPQFDSALLIYDEGAGYRRFLGADIDTAYALHELCDDQVTFDESFVVSDGIVHLSNSLVEAIAPDLAPIRPNAPPHSVGKWGKDGKGALEIITTRFYPELLDTIVEQIHSLLSNDKLPSFRDCHPSALSFGRAALRHHESTRGAAAFPGEHIVHRVHYAMNLPRKRC